MKNTRIGLQILDGAKITQPILKSLLPHRTMVADVQ